MGPFSLGMLTFFDHVRTFYSVRSFIPLNGGKTFWLSWWCLENDRAIIILQAAVRDCWRNGLSSSLSFHSVSSAGQVVAGCLKWPKKFLSSILLVKWVMIVRETRSRILFETLATGSGLNIQIGGIYCMLVHVLVRTEG